MCVCGGGGGCDHRHVSVHWCLLYCAGVAAVVDKPRPFCGDFVLILPQGVASLESWRELESIL